MRAGLESFGAVGLPLNGTAPFLLPQERATVRRLRPAVAFALASRKCGLKIAVSWDHLQLMRRGEGEQTEYFAILELGRQELEMADTFDDEQWPTSGRGGAFESRQVLTTNGATNFADAPEIA